MDLVESFLRANKVFSVSVLIVSYTELISLHLNDGSISFEELVTIVRKVVPDMETVDTKAHAALLFESCLELKIYSRDQMTLQLKSELNTENKIIFLQIILHTMRSRMKDEYWPSVSEFERQASYYHPQQLILPSAEARSTTAATEITLHSRGVVQMDPSTCTLTSQSSPSDQRPHFQTNIPSSFERKTCTISSTSALSLPENLVNIVSKSSGGDFIPAVSPSTDIEKSEPMVRLLAQMRKVGMDMLFPQTVHDKILACVFVAVRSGIALAHREIIDMVMAAKESRIVNEIEAVSKTKVRGILALLKHGELLTARGLDGEPIRLVLTANIQSFRDFRDRHDMFLSRFMMEHQIFLPVVLKAEVEWQLDADRKRERLASVERIMKLLQVFFSSTKSGRNHLNRKGTDMLWRHDTRITMNERTGMGIGNGMGVGVCSTRVDDGIRPLISRPAAWSAAMHSASNRLASVENFSFTEPATEINSSLHRNHLPNSILLDSAGLRVYADEPEPLQRYRQPSGAGADEFVQRFRGDNVLITPLVDAGGRGGAPSISYQRSIETQQTYRTDSTAAHQQQFYSEQYHHRKQQSQMQFSHFMSSRTAEGDHASTSRSMTGTDGSGSLEAVSLCEQERCTHPSYPSFEEHMKASQNRIQQISENNLGEVNNQMSYIDRYGRGPSGLLIAAGSMPDNARYMSHRQDQRPKSQDTQPYVRLEDVPSSYSSSIRPTAEVSGPSSAFHFEDKSRSALRVNSSISYDSAFRVDTTSALRRGASPAGISQRGGVENHSKTHPRDRFLSGLDAVVAGSDASNIFHSSTGLQG